MEAWQLFGANTPFRPRGVTRVGVAVSVFLPQLDLLADRDRPAPFGTTPLFGICDSQRMSCHRSNSFDVQLNPSDRGLTLGFCWPPMPVGRAPGICRPRAVQVLAAVGVAVGSTTAARVACRARNDLHEPCASRHLVRVVPLSAQARCPDVHRHPIYTSWARRAARPSAASTPHAGEWMVAIDEACESARARMILWVCVARITPTHPPATGVAGARVEAGL